MSQKATRKSLNPTVIIISDDKEKADSPVKEMKKKIAANAEKDKQAAEKPDKPTEKADKSEPADKNKVEKSNENKSDKIADKSDKNVDKPDKNADKSDKNADKSDKNADKADKNADKADKNADKSDKSDKNADKSDKNAEKKSDKSEKATDKKEKTGDKKADKSIEKKSEQTEKDDSKGDKTKEKGARAVNGHNGAANGDDVNGTVSDGSDGDLVIEEDEAFPELTYDDTDSDADDAPSRSLTRRSQVKVTKTPETPAPRPASEKESDDSKEVKMKLTEPVAPSDRKLRSSDSPRPDAKKLDKKQDAAQEEEKKTKKDLEASKKKELEEAEKDGQNEKMDVEVVVVEAENSEGVVPRTRARVSPYSRTRLDRTTTSVTADYTGNNSTMEMDITESSIVEDSSLNDSGYLRAVRGMRGRSSYKQLKELKLTNPNANRPRPPPTAASIRPMGAVVGRKRKPSSDSSPVELGEEAVDDIFASHGKRMKLLDRLSMPFRRSITRRAAEIVGINTDLPLMAPVASTSFAPFDPESMKVPPPAPRPDAPLATPLPARVDTDNKRCLIM